ncbi:MAG: GTP-binding protein [Gammaproteobacteria bacterium]|nr:MAG: GTP-binding protein [Gammaproteobacteria bacterium]
MSLPVNLITGFLGTGKTSLIRHLLQHPPPGQKWAVLVNEFGEVGVDGALLDDTGVAIEEVAGGCLCCVAAPAFTTGLNRLIRQHRPDRILIEPSGLGHPAQVLDQLRSPPYQGVLAVQATLCLIDPRHLDSPRHLAHPTFQDQIHLADVLVGNKTDLCDETAIEHFLAFAATLEPPKEAVLLATHGRIDPTVLTRGATQRRAAFPEAHAYLLSQQSRQEHPPPTQDAWLRYTGEEDGYHRLGWWIGPAHRFDRAALLTWLEALPSERIKGVLACTGSGLRYNRSADDPTEIADIEPPAASHLQLIDPEPFDLGTLDSALRALLANTAST